MRGWRSRLTCRILIPPAATLLVLALLEIVLQLSGLDLWLLARVVPSMKQEQGVHHAVRDPRLLIRLRPGASASFQTPMRTFRVSINSLGFRGPERARVKAPGVFRILCVGASNVYGAGLNDNETWPHLLQRRLNQGAPGRYEVWNLGVSGYNSLQLAVIAAEALAHYDPDLVLYSMSNRGPRHFLDGTVSLELFREDPTLWQETFPPVFLESPPWPSPGDKAWLLGRVALYRLALLGALGASEDGQSGIAQAADDRYVAATRAFLAGARGKVKLAVHICPAVKPRRSFDAHYAGLGLPVMYHDAAGKTAEYELFHPPAHVMDWYAEVIARWLQQQGLLGGRS